jgi:hypothetical protein
MHAGWVEVMREIVEGAYGHFQLNAMPKPYGFIRRVDTPRQPENLQNPGQAVATIVS